MGDCIPRVTNVTTAGGHRMKEGTAGLNKKVRDPQGVRRRRGGVSHINEAADGCAVVHAVHGAGRITDHEGGGREFVVFVPLAGPGELTVLMPHERAGEHLRGVRSTPPWPCSTTPPTPRSRRGWRRRAR